MSIAASLTAMMSVKNCQTTPQRSGQHMELARDIEYNLQPGQSWHLDVRHGRAAVFLIEIKGHRRR
jgi:hypothetical protein